MARRQKRFLKVVELPNNQPASHPFNNEKNHENLLNYCMDRVNLACTEQAYLKDRFSVIDIELAGFLQLDKEDTERRTNNLRGKDPKPTPIKPQFVLSQLNRGVTFLLSVFAPDSGVFEALASKDEQKMANAFTELMNQHADKTQYFRNQAKFFLNCLKYNLGPQRVDWVQRVGNVITDEGGTIGIKQDRVFAGNIVEATDPYNTFWDPSVHPCDVHSEGEFAGEIECMSQFRAKRLVEQGQLFNMQEMFDGDMINIGVEHNSRYYRPPTIRYTEGDGYVSAYGGPNWMSILSQGAIRGYDGPNFELIHQYIRLIPGEFGLITAGQARTRNRTEIWRVTIANNMKIVATEFLSNAHDYLPYLFAVPIEDHLGLQSKSHGEQLLPFQEFGTFLFNTHVKASRKNIWDMIVYDPTVVDLKAVGNDVAGRIPMLPGGYGKDPRASIWHPEKTLETRQTLQDVKDLLELMEYFFPTRLMQQVADIDRAVKDQVMAMITAASRENWKLAKIIDDQAQSPMRKIMHSNIMQYQESIQIKLPGGETFDLDPSKLRAAKLEFKIGEGLKTIDKMQIRLFVKELINTILQTQAIAEFDVPGLVNYLSTLFGVETDLTQFTRTTPQQMPVDPNKETGPTAGKPAPVAQRPKLVGA